MRPARPARSMSTDPLGGRLAVDRHTLELATGDVAMIALFVLLGELRHGGSLLAGVVTFGQFGLSWAVAAVLAGAYAADALSTPGQAVLRALGAWVVAALVVQLVRVLLEPGSAVQPTFVLVSIGFGGLFIGLWRFVAARRLH